MTGNGFDYDVIVIGSGFGGSVAALRATEKGYRVAVLESGRRWPDEDIPKTSWDIRKFAWQPEAEMYGIQRIEFLDDVLVLCGAGVGGGSHHYAQTLYVPPKKFFDAPEWAGITDWADELAPHIDQARRMLGVVPVPYMDTQMDRLMREVAGETGRGETYNKAPVGVYFGTPGVEADDPYFGGEGPRRRGCIGCGNCMIGCGHNAKNKLTVNYLYLAEKHGAVIHELHEVHEVKPLAGGGFEVLARHPGWMQRAAHLHHHKYAAAQVIVSAHAYGSAKLLHRLKHAGTLAGLSDQLGKRARTNSEQLISIARPYGEWKRDPDRFHITPGSVAITSGVWPDDQTSIEPVYYGVGSDLMTFVMTYHQDGAQKHPVEGWLKSLIEHPSEVLDKLDARHWSERQLVLLCMQTSDTSIDLYWKDGMLRSRHGIGPAPSTHIPVVEAFADRLARKMHGEQAALWTEVLNRTASAHFIGGITIGELELGGKNPTVVHSTANLEVAAHRIAYGRYLNSGHICTAPDHVLVWPEVKDAFVQHLAETIREFYGDDPKLSPDYGRVINRRNFDRLVGLLGSGKAVVGGQTDANERYIAPTVLVDVSPDSPIMQEEVFGPILPVLEIDSVEAVIQWVNHRPRPLGLYVFAEDLDVAERILDATESGDAAINDCTIHPLIPELPFGGVGNSGMGKYHGRWGFEAFTNARGVMYHSTSIDPGVRYPPYAQHTFTRKIQGKLMP